MVYKYRSLIIDTLLENPKNGLGFSNLYKGVQDKLGINLSPTYFSDGLVKMLQEGLISKKAKLYCLSEMSNQALILGILCVNDEKIASIHALYLFMVIGEKIYKPKLISEKDLGSLLKYGGANLEDLEHLEESCIITNGSNCSQIIYKPILTIKLGADRLENADGTFSSNYNYQEEGLTFTEVMDLLEGSREYPIFVGNFNYTQSMVQERIDFLRQAGFLRVVGSFRTEGERYTTDDAPLSQRGVSIREMIDKLWNIHRLEYYYLQHKRNLTQYEKEGLRRLFGSLGSYKFIKSSQSQSQKKLFSYRDLKGHLEMVSSAIDFKIKKFYQQYQSVLKTNYLYSDLANRLIIRESVLKGICGLSNQYYTP